MNLQAYTFKKGVIKNLNQRQLLFLLHDGIPPLCLDKRTMECTAKQNQLLIAPGT